MTNKIFSDIKNHPDYNATIEEVINKDFDEAVMAEAFRRTARESRAEALYVLLKLKSIK
ncbi:hypothetical protein [Colwellia sp. 75C3]|uniref:hypothetical protein n=1 Tax=Colwellia sp. 75C3 TaxID=888425 RepID=UPI0012FEEBAF|nr:hypothetical protein [Colwellia sp. 75C3]